MLRLVGVAARAVGASDEGVSRCDQVSLPLHG